MLVSVPTRDRPASLALALVGLIGGLRERSEIRIYDDGDSQAVANPQVRFGLDALTRLRLQALAAELLAGRTVLLVTHDPLEALRLGDHVLVMNGRPATLSPLPDLPGAPPRDPGEPAVQTAYRAILRLLGAA